jgi:hypothetical protein
VDIAKARNNPWNEIVNQSIFNSRIPGKYVELDIKKKLLLKIQNENLLPKGGGGDQPSLGQKAFLYHFIEHHKVNVAKYFFKYMVKELKESQLLEKSLGSLWETHIRNPSLKRDSELNQ